MNYLGMNLIKSMQDLYAKNCKILLRVIKVVLNKKVVVPCV